MALSVDGLGPFEWRWNLDILHSNLALEFLRYVADCFEIQLNRMRTAGTTNRQLQLVIPVLFWGENVGLLEPISNKLNQWQAILDWSLIHRMRVFWQQTAAALGSNIPQCAFLFILVLPKTDFNCFKDLFIF